MSSAVTPPAVAFDHVTCRFGDVAAVDDVSFAIEPGEFFSLLGPSGCGKTTTLRLLAGFELPDAGTVSIAGRDAAARRPYERDVGLVFQNYALFPHMSVAGNVAFGLEQRRVSSAERAERVERALEMVRLDPRTYGARRPGELSGGQRQRVALARAIVLEPSVLLLDEPLGALDLKLRKDMQLELKRLNRELGITFVYVTHDQDEALTMSDRVAVMNHARIAQVGTPAAIYERPESAFVARFIGSVNLLPGEVIRQEGKTCVLKTAAGTLRASCDEGLRAGIEAELAVRPEWVTVTANGRDAPADALTGRVRDLLYRGESVQVVIDIPGTDGLTAVVRGGGADGLVTRGTAVTLHWPVERARALVR